MRRWIYLGVSALCCLGLWYLNMLWSGLSGQALFRMTAGANPGDSLQRIADGLEFGGFYVSEQEDFLLYETTAYHPDAMGVVLLKGAPITREQIESGGKVIMLSETAANRISPELNCLGDFVTIGEDSYRVIGIYRENAPLLTLTRAAEASAIIPARRQTEVRRFYAWFRAGSGMPFAFQTLLRELEQLNAVNDLGAFQAYNLDQISRMNRQGIRFWALMLLSILCFRGFRALAASRSAFAAEAKRALSRHYFVGASARLIPPFSKHILPSLSILAAWIMYLAFCARQLIISAERVPVKLLDPEAWLIRQDAFLLAANRAESLPVYSYLLSSHLQTLCALLGLVAAWCLWKGTKNRKA